MEFDYVVCVRNVQQGQFGAEPGRTQFLAIPAQSSALPSPGKTGHEITRTAWVRKVLDQAKTGVNPKTGEPVGDLLVFIHGYNNSQAVVMWRHRRLKADLEAARLQIKAERGAAARRQRHRPQGSSGGHGRAHQQLLSLRLARRLQDAKFGLRQHLGDPCQEQGGEIF